MHVFSDFLCTEWGLIFVYVNCLLIKYYKAENKLCGAKDNAPIPLTNKAVNCIIKVV